MKIKETYTSEDIENLNCLGFIGTMAMIAVATLAKIVGII